MSEGKQIKAPRLRLQSFTFGLDIAVLYAFHTSNSGKA
jgi:hypothetical protein